MNKETILTRGGGAVFMIAALLFLANKFNDMSRLFLSRPMADVISKQTPLLILLGQVTLVIGFVAYYGLYARRVKRPVKIALGLFCSGGILLAVGHFGFMEIFSIDTFILVLLGVALLLIGLIWFGIANLRRPILNRWQWLPLATGLMGFIGFILLGGRDITAIFLFFRTSFSLGLFGLGLVLWMEKPVQNY